MLASEHTIFEPLDQHRQSHVSKGDWKCSPVVSATEPSQASGRHHAAGHRFVPSNWKWPAGSSVLTPRAAPPALATGKNIRVGLPMKGLPLLIRNEAKRHSACYCEFLARIPQQQVLIIATFWHHIGCIEYF